ncbi:hypothetical protein PILCRDRAFT_385156 [Piloderma croceum F 1598]|uniref:Uncharacterized protein n=1 Tax=Piloderma croceum (strain F 1598) TaxID=765440 RepID=A0A0C3BDW0_PILCF|nr:hypothetical protein PILCRDRAFT_385156 [Piloderma croceum F 1598]
MPNCINKAMMCRTPPVTILKYNSGSMPLKSFDLCLSSQRLYKYKPTGTSAIWVLCSRSYTGLRSFTYVSNVYVAADRLWYTS